MRLLAGLRLGAGGEARRCPGRGREAEQDRGNALRWLRPLGAFGEPQDRQGTRASDARRDGRVEARQFSNDYQGAVCRAGG